MDTEVSEKILYKGLRQYVSSLLEELAIQKGCRIEGGDLMTPCVSIVVTSNFQLEVFD